MSLLKLKSLWYPIGTSVQESQRLYNSLQDYFISLYSEQRQFTKILLSLFIKCSVPGVVLLYRFLIFALILTFYAHTRTDLQEIWYTVVSSQIK